MTYIKVKYKSRRAHRISFYPGTKYLRYATMEIKLATKNIQKSQTQNDQMSLVVEGAMLSYLCHQKAQVLMSVSYKFHPDTKYLHYATNRKQFGMKCTRIQ